jgi:hypothetical protein
VRRRTEDRMAGTLGAGRRSVDRLTDGPVPDGRRGGFWYRDDGR